MARLGLLAAALFLLAPALRAQHVDVFPGHCFIWDSIDGGGENASAVIYRLDRLDRPDRPDAGGALTRIDVPPPEDASWLWGPRPKVRNGRLWISNGEKILSRPLDAPGDEPWGAVLLPKGVANFQEFEIISDAEAMLIGALWDREDQAGRARLDMHFVFDLETGAVKKAIASHAPWTLEALERGGHGPLHAAMLWAKLFDFYVCRLDPYVLIVGRNTGSVVRYDIDGGRATEHQIVPPEGIPEDPNVAINNGSAISWVGPLAGGEALMLCRDRLEPLPKGLTNYVVYLGDDGEEVQKPAPWGSFSQVNSFRTMDLASGRVRSEGARYKGFDAKPMRTLLEWDGELLPALDAVARAAARTTMTTAADAAARDGRGGDGPASGLVGEPAAHGGPEDAPPGDAPVPATAKGPRIRD
jgi:hypothetical protein